MLNGKSTVLGLYDGPLTAMCRIYCSNLWVGHSAPLLEPNHLESLTHRSAGILYLDSININSSELSFRDVFFMHPEEYGRGEHGAGIHDAELALTVMASFDTDSYSSPVQNYGSLKCKVGRGVCFPNLYQHKVEPFGLTDPAQPGHRTIIAFFVCDPTRTVPSTSQIPPQQPDCLKVTDGSRRIEKQSKLRMVLILGSSAG